MRFEQVQRFILTKNIFGVIGTLKKLLLIINLTVHSTKLRNSDWSRAVQLIPNSTPKEYLLSFHDNGA